MKARVFVASFLLVSSIPSLAAANDSHVSHQQKPKSPSTSTVTKVCSQPTYARVGGKFVPVTEGTCGVDGFTLASSRSEPRRTGERSRN